MIYIKKTETKEFWKYELIANIINKSSNTQL